MDFDTLRVILTVFQVIGGAFCTLLFFMVKAVIAKGDTTAASLAAFQLHVAQTYTSDARLTQLLAPLTEAIRDIQREIKTKQDKA